MNNAERGRLSYLLGVAESLKGAFPNCKSLEGQAEILQAHEDALEEVIYIQKKMLRKRARPWGIVPRVFSPRSN